MDKQEQLMKGLGESVRRIMEKLEGDFGWLQEIRMRIGAPRFVILSGGGVCRDKTGAAAQRYSEGLPDHAAGFERDGGTDEQLFHVCL